MSNFDVGTRIDRSGGDNTKATTMALPEIDTTQWDLMNSKDASGETMAPELAGEDD